METKYYKYDIFISYASEDSLFVSDLTKHLSELGMRVWVDKISIEIGDSIIESIDTGLKNCKFGILILSDSFFRKPWTKKELDGFITREIFEKRKVILPILHKIEIEKVNEYSPTLAGRLCINSSEGVIEIGDKINKIINPYLDDVKIINRLINQRGIRFKEVDIHIHISDFGLKWFFKRSSKIVAIRNNVEGVSISYNVNDILRESIKDRVHSDFNVSVESRKPLHPKKTKRFIRFNPPLQNGDEIEYEYQVEFLKRNVIENIDYFMYKSISECKRLNLYISFDFLPKELYFRITDRAESYEFFRSDIINVTKNVVLKRTIENPDKQMAFGFKWNLSM